MHFSFFDTFGELLKSEAVQSILRYFTSGRFFITILAIALTTALVIVSNSALKFYLRKQKELNGDSMNGERITLLHVLGSIVSGIIVVIAVIFIMQLNGLEVSSLITSVSIISAIVGLALQDTIKDIIQGIQILSDRFFMVGDVVKYDGFEGKIIKFTIRSTKLEDIRSKSIITVSNRNISKIEKTSDKRFIHVPISYNEPVQKMFELFPAICDKVAENEEISECSFLGLNEMADSSMKYLVMIVCDPAVSPRLIRYTNKVIVEELAANGIQIPFNQLDVHLDKE